MSMSSAARRHLVPLRLLRLLTFVLLLQLSHGFDAFGAALEVDDSRIQSSTTRRQARCSRRTSKASQAGAEESPDKGGDPEKFKKINEAYAVLSDEQKRAAYDRMGKAAVDGSCPAA